MSRPVDKRGGLRIPLGPWQGSVAVFLISLLAAGIPNARESGEASEISPTGSEAQAIYGARCAACHDAAIGRTPPSSALVYLPPEVIVRALEKGSMQPMAAGLSTRQIRELARHISLLPDRASQRNPENCGKSSEDAAPGRGPDASDDWPLTGRDGRNTRFQERPGLSAADVPKLELLWAVAIPGGASGSPVLAEGRLLISTGAGQILALDTERACTLWTFEHDRLVRTLSVALAPEPGGLSRVLFADDRGLARALDASTGELLWETAVEDHPLNRATAAPGFHAGRVFVTMSSIEDPLTHDPTHTCCTSRGSVTALDAVGGRILWKQYTVEKTPVQIQPASGTRPARYSPAGGSVYTPVTIDAQRGLVYVSTAEAYTREDAKGAYSVLALEMASGERVWQRQFLPNPEDRKSVCEGLGHTDCRNAFSMGTSVTLHIGSDDEKGSDLLLVGQKWGYVYALDPDRKGALVWKRRVARGSDMGGIMYGLADDGKALYVPVSDVYAELPDRPGDLVALAPMDGRLLWRARQPEAVCSWGADESCVGAQSAAPTAIPGVVFASAWDGFVRAHASSDGEVIWEFDTGRVFDGINGKAQGGQIAAYPIQVVKGRVYVTSGASSLARPGNALLIFGLPK